MGPAVAWVAQEVVAEGTGLPREVEVAKGLVKVQEAPVESSRLRVFSVTVVFEVMGQPPSGLEY